MHSSAKKLQRVLSSREIRKTFIEYFINNHDHKFVRSSPVVPFCDPTVAFVNAGMNQVRPIGDCKHNLQLTNSLNFSLNRYFWAKHKPPTNGSQIPRSVCASEVNTMICRWWARMVIIILSLKCWVIGHLVITLR